MPQQQDWHAHLVISIIGRVKRAKDPMILLGREPDMEWREYPDLVFQLARECGKKNLHDR
jgi:hypothetical protein